MREGNVLCDRYRLLERIGQGSFGVVYRAEELLQGEVICEVAVKAFTVEVNLKEVRTLAGLSHPHILAYRAAILHEGQACLVTELADGGDMLQQLSAYPKGLPVEQVEVIGRQVAGALDYLHANNLVHRDVKPSNILYVGDAAKLGDVGTARAVSGAMTRHTGVGTFGYSAPEMFDGQVGPASDAYALGVTMYELCTGRLPFEGTTQQVMKQHIMADIQIPEGLPSRVSALIRACMEKDPAARMSVKDVKQALADPMHTVSGATPSGVMQDPAGETSSPPVSAPPGQAASASPVESNPLQRVDEQIRTYLKETGPDWEDRRFWSPFWDRLQQSGLDRDILLGRLQAVSEALRRQDTPASSPPPPAAPAPRPEPQVGPSPSMPQHAEFEPPLPTSNVNVSSKGEPSVATPMSAEVDAAIAAYLQRVGDTWERSENWAPFRRSLSEKLAEQGVGQRHLFNRAETLYGALKLREMNSTGHQVLLMAWVQGLEKGRWSARQWMSFLDTCPPPLDEDSLARDRDALLARLFPAGSKARRNLHLADGDSSGLELIYLPGEKVWPGEILGDLLAQEPEPGQTPRPRGIWITPAPLTRLQLDLLLDPLGSTSDRQNEPAMVRREKLETQVFPAVARRHPLEELRLPTWEEVQAVKKAQGIAEKKLEPRVLKKGMRKPESIWGKLGLAALATAEVLAHEAEKRSSEWTGEAYDETAVGKDRKKRPLRLVSPVPKLTPITTA